MCKYISLSSSQSVFFVGVLSHCVVVLLPAQLPYIPAEVLHHLYSHAPKELASPWQRAGLEPAQYSTWLDQHSELEVWRGVKGTLEAYAKSCKTRGKPVDPVHGVMVTVGERMHAHATAAAAAKSPGDKDANGKA